MTKSSKRKLVMSADARDVAQRFPSLLKYFKIKDLEKGVEQLPPNMFDIGPAY